MSEAKRFGKYQLFERIAVGGMAEVFRAKGQGADKELALKRIHPHHLENDDFVSMLIDEAKISFQLDHPNIVQVVDMGRVDKHYFIAMEYIAGRDLRRVMERVAESGRSFPVPEGIAIVARVARGLDYAHGKADGRGQRMEIIHRDISPQNILIGFDGHVKVIDFGIAKAAGRLMETQVGILKGKYAYMSPEQAAGGQLDQRTDIFSTGIMLYECLVGKHPFRAAHDLETLRNIKDSRLVPPREANPNIPVSVERVIMQALATLKEDRYFTAGAMAADLEAALAKLKPGFGNSQIADFIDGLFADEIAAGGVRSVEEPASNQRTEAAGSRGAQAFKLNRNNTSGGTSGGSRSGSLSGGGQTATPPRASGRLLAPQSGTSSTTSPVPGVRQAPGTASNGGFAGFIERVQTGRHTATDSIVLVLFASVVFVLAVCLLLWEPGVVPKPSNPTAAPVGTAAVVKELFIDSSPSGAEVTIGGKSRGVTPVTLTVSGAGANTLIEIIVKKDGYAIWTGKGTPGTPVMAMLRSE